MKRKWMVVALALVVALLMSGISFAQTPYVSKIERGNAPKEALVLVTFNAFNIGKTKMQKAKEVFPFMADMFRDADIIAIQEVSTLDGGAFAIAFLANKLNNKGGSWDYISSDPTDGPGTERFSFLWNTAKVQAIPRHAPLSQSVKDLLDREPAKIRFRVGQKSFTLFSFHLVPTDKNPRKEVEALGKNPAEFIDGPAIFVGDFNLPPSKMTDVFGGILHASYQIDGKTSLKKKLDKKGSYYQKEYDNIFTRGMRVYQAGIIDFVPAFSNLKQARILSDHLPSYAVFIIE